MGIFLASIVEFMTFSFIYIIMIVGDRMNNFEIIRIINRMLDNTRIVSIDMNLYYIMEGLGIDKNIH